MILLVGESASGKSTVEKELVNNYGYNKIVSYTTREPRKSEVDGVDYHYISVEEFNQKEKKGFFCEIGEYNGWKYGTAKEDCTDDKVVVITPHGMRQMKRIEGLNLHTFYINVPRRDRLIKILQRGDSIEEAYRRSVSDSGMFDGIQDEVDFTIDNHNYHLTPKQIAVCITQFIGI